MLTVSEQPIDGKFRILGADGQIAQRTDNGNPVDHGGSEDHEKLVRMAGHIQKSMNEADRRRKARDEQGPQEA
jgi:hypothetical protein